MLLHHKKVKDSSLYRDNNRPGYEKCNGCRVCTLPCPVWHQTHDITLTHCGRARAIQGGADHEDIRDSINACILCGACESVCPFGIDTIGMTMDLRHMLNEKKSALTSMEEPTHEKSASGFHKRVILPGKVLRSDDQLMNVIHNLFVDADTAIAGDDGSDISQALESGVPVSGMRREQFQRSLAGAKELIVSEGILRRGLCKWLPDVKITGLGKALLDKADIKASLGPEDLYIIETRGYNGDYSDMVREYDLVRKETGCQMNVDLQRSAIPTGAVSIGSKVVSPFEQAKWIIKGRRFKRIVVESPEDIKVFEGVTDVEVIHVSQLVKGNTL